jgi:hypothetical protein
MIPRLHEKHRYRLAVCGYNAFETSAVCLALMVKGSLLSLTLGHFATASRTGVLAILPVLGLSMTRQAALLAGRWTAPIIAGLCGFGADVLTHPSHFPGAYTEAALTALGTFVLSIGVSRTPVGRYIDRLAETFLRGDPTVLE